MRYGPARPLLIPLLLACILFAFVWFRDPGMGHWLNQEGSFLLQAALWLAVFWLVNRLIRVLIWQRRVHRLSGTAAPLLLQHVVTLVLLALTIAAIARFVYGLPIAGFWATSSVLGLVLGIALRSLIADFFSGIALELDPPFKIGEYIELRRANQESIVGQVVEVNWRATQVRPRGQIHTVFVPNSQLSALSVVNSYQPLNRSRFEAAVTLDASVPPEHAGRLLVAAALVSEGVLQHPAPDALMTRLTNAGIEYKVRYWLAPESSPDEVRHAVLSNLMEQVARSGVRLGYEKSEVTLSRRVEPSPDSRARKENFLRRTPLFETLKPEELRELASVVHTVHVPAQQTVIHAGESGATMYVVAEGVLHALLPGTGEKPVTAGQLAPGDFFGEMSLLTGEPRSATIVSTTDALLYQVSRDHLQHLIAARPGIAEHMTHVAAERHLKNREVLKFAGGAMTDEHRELRTQILVRMRAFFGLAG